MAAFRKLVFPDQLYVLKQYIGSSGYLKHLISYYAKLIKLLQARKVELLAKRKKKGRVTNGKPAQKAIYCRKTRFKPLKPKKAVFKAVQTAIYNRNSILYYYNLNKKLILQIDIFLEKGFGIIVFQLRDGFKNQQVSGKLVFANQVFPVIFLSKYLIKPELRYRLLKIKITCLIQAAKKLKIIIYSSNIEPVFVLTNYLATKSIVK